MNGLGHFKLDFYTNAYFIRCNEVCIISTYPSSNDPWNAIRAVESVKYVLVELCSPNKRVSEVTLLTLNKRNIEVQFAIRKVIAGLGRISKIGASAKLDFASLVYSPDTSNEDAAMMKKIRSFDVTGYNHTSAVEA